MKTAHRVSILVGAVLLGGLGVCATHGVWGDRNAAIRHEPGQSPETADLQPTQTVPTPKAVVDKTEHDFGSMDPMSQAQHTFVVHNGGTAPLKLDPGPTTCKCTLSDLPDRTVLPGREGRIVISWKAADKQGPVLQTATIRTNDPARPSLTLRILGTVRVRLGVEPAQLVFPGLARGQAETATVLVFSQVWPDFTIPKIESSRVGLTCSMEPADPEALKEHRACAGYRLRVQLPADLPSGDFSEWLQIHVDPRDETTPRQTHPMAVAGRVLAPMTIYGEKIDGGKVLRLVLSQANPSGFAWLRTSLLQGHGLCQGC